MADQQVSWVDNFFKQLMEGQYDVLATVSEEKKRQGYGRAAQIIIDGPHGGIYDVWFCAEGVRQRPADIPVKNRVHMTEDTLLDLITPNIELDELVARVQNEGFEKALMHLYPRLDFRTAIANGFITVDGDKPDVDSEEWSQILDAVLLKIAFPTVVKAMLRDTKAKGA